METAGSIVDKLATVNQKLFINQEVLYDIRRMGSFEVFEKEYGADQAARRALYDTLIKIVDLNIQRTSLIAEFDAKIVEIVKAAAGGAELGPGDSVFIQRAHKTL